MCTSNIGGPGQLRRVNIYNKGGQAMFYDSARTCVGWVGTGSDQVNCLKCCINDDKNA